MRDVLLWSALSLVFSIQEHMLFQSQEEQLPTSSSVKSCPILHSLGSAEVPLAASPVSVCPRLQHLAHLGRQAISLSLWRACHQGPLLGAKTLMVSCAVG